MDPARRHRELMDLGADQLLTPGQAQDAVATFTAALAASPSTLPQHWMRGLAQYYAGAFADGSAQFAANMAANGSDAEEVIWRWLCDVGDHLPAWCRDDDDGGVGAEAPDDDDAAERRAAVAAAVAYARGRMLPLDTPDTRPCLMDALALFAGGGGNLGDDGSDPKDVVAPLLNAAAAAVPEHADPAARRTALAYARLYAGLFLEATAPGRGAAWRAEAARHIRASARAPSADFMGRLAGMHAARARARARFVPRCAPAWRSPPPAGGSSSPDEAPPVPPYTHSRVILGGWQWSEGHHAAPAAAEARMDTLRAFNADAGPVEILQDTFFFGSERAAFAHSYGPDPHSCCRVRRGFTAGSPRSTWATSTPGPRRWWGASCACTARGCRAARRCTRSSCPTWTTFARTAARRPCSTRRSCVPTHSAASTGSASRGRTSCSSTGGTSTAAATRRCSATSPR